MPNSMRWFLVSAAMCGGLCGCKSGPGWDWWRVGKSGAPESSPIARSAGPPLPSELVQQGDPTALGGNLQVPVVDSGTDPAIGGQAPAYSAASSLASSGYPSTAGGYPATGGGAAGSFATPPSSTGSADPFARGSASAGGATAQNQYYDPNAFAASSAAPSQTQGAMESDRYAYNPSAYGAASGGSTAGASSATPWPPQTASSAPNMAAAYESPAGTPGNYAAAASQVAGSYGGVTSYGGSPGATGAMQTPTTTGERYSSSGLGSSAQATQIDPSLTAASSSAAYSAGLSAAGQTAAPHYRPGGTSDYVGTGGSAQVNIASRQSLPASAPAATTAPAQDGPSYRYGTQPPYADTGAGQRY